VGVGAGTNPLDRAANRDADLCLVEPIVEHEDGDIVALEHVASI